MGLVWFVLFAPRLCEQTRYSSLVGSGKYFKLGDMNK